VSGMRVLLGVLVSTWRWPARREQRLSAAEAIQEFECEMDAQCFAGVDEHKDHAAAARAARDDARRPGVDAKLGHEARHAAVLAGPGRWRHLRTECLVERTGDRVAVQR